MRKKDNSMRSFFHENIMLYFIESGFLLSFSHFLFVLHIESVYRVTLVCLTS